MGSFQYGETRAFTIGGDDDATEGEQGVELRLSPAYSSRRIAGGLDLGWQGTLLTYLQHGETARQAFVDR